MSFALRQRTLVCAFTARDTEWFECRLITWRIYRVCWNSRDYGHSLYTDFCMGDLSFKPHRVATTAVQVIHIDSKGKFSACMIESDATG